MSDHCGPTCVERLLDGALQLCVHVSSTWLVRKLTPPAQASRSLYDEAFERETDGGEVGTEVYAAYLRHRAEEAADQGVEDTPPDTPLSRRCFIYLGCVSYVGNEGGLVDENRFFDRRDGPADLREGEVVTVLAYAQHERSREWTILRLYRSVRTPVCDVASSSRMVVTARIERKVEIDGGTLVVDLDTVRTQFAPRVGDVVFATPDSVRWFEYCTLRGRVTRWDVAAGEGIVAGEDVGDVALHRDACTPGFRPRVEDRVTADAIRTVDGWRALLAVHAGSPAFDRSVPTCSSNEMRVLLLPKRGMSFSAKTFDFGRVPIGGKSGPLVVTATNEGQYPYFIVNINSHMAHQFPQARIDDLHSYHGRSIFPGESVDVTFRCTGTFLGHSREVAVFFFHGFAIGVALEMEVVHADAHLMESAGSSNQRAPRFYHGISVERNQHILSGERPIQPPKFIECRLGQYNVPDRYWEAFLNNANESKATPEIQKDVEELTPCLREYLGFDSFAERFHALLYLEEVDAMLKLRRYKMERVRLVVEDEFVKLEVPGLAEKRPALLVGDIVLASRPWRGDGLVYEAFVHKALDSHVLVRFNPEFHETVGNGEYNVEFKLGRTAYRRQHAAIDVAVTHLGGFLLFPSRLDLRPPQVRFYRRPGHEGMWYDPADSDEGQTEVTWLNGSLDEFQRGAVLNALAGVARPLPYVIFGPPGTGKTMTLVELVLKIFLLLPESRLLVATPSNSSANLLAERLIESGRVRPGDLVRLVGYHVYEDGSLPAALLPFCTTGNIKMVAGPEAQPAPVGKLGMSSNKSTLVRHRIVVGTCIALGQLFTMGLPHGSFTHVLVDEAAQATEPEILVALDFLKPGGQIILAGDPMQLGPVVSSNLANQYGLGESYLDRLLHRFPYQADRISHPDTEGYDPRLVSFLLNNYRTAPEILKLPNDLFYESKLLPQVSDESGPAVDMLASLSWFLPRRYQRPTSAIIFHGVRGTDLQETESPSWFNPQEALVVLQYLQSLCKSGVHASDIGIITPYRKQVQKMRWFYSWRLREVPKIGSVEEFQGQEKKVIIVSVVRSSTNPKVLESDIVHSLGFVSCPQRLNVALTRAQNLLIVVGNPHVLSKDPYWRATLKYCVDINAYWGCDLPVELMASVGRYLR